MAETLELECYFALDSSDVHTNFGGHVGEDINLEENDCIVTVPDIDECV